MLKVCARHEYEEIERERRGEEGRQKKKKIEEMESFARRETIHHERSH